MERIEMKVVALREMVNEEVGKDRIKKEVDRFTADQEIGGYASFRSPTCRKYFKDWVVELIKGEIEECAQIASTHGTYADQITADDIRKRLL
jgi:hypothetical protein